MTIEDANAHAAGHAARPTDLPHPAAARLVRECGWNSVPVDNRADRVRRRNDYAMNGGDYAQWNQPSPPSLAAADAPSFPWDDMSHQTGISHQRSQVRMSAVTDGASNTFLVGEKYINSDHYSDGCDWGDAATFACGGDREILRWTGALVVGNPPTPDRSTAIPEGTEVQWFGKRMPPASTCRFATARDPIGSLLDRRRGLSPPWQPQRRSAG